MKKLFGTDGIRGVVNTYPMTTDMAVRIGKATATFFIKDGKNSQIIIGKDTRKSGDMLESALVAGICSVGVEAQCVGIFPTPGIASITTATEANAGVVISASHNPFQDNGIKIFKTNGFKLSDDEEKQIEKIIFDNNFESQLSLGSQPGQVRHIDDSNARYRSFLMSCFPDKYSLKGLKIVLDCSNGATYQIAPELYSELGADVIPLFTSPNGTNINDGCGSQHLEVISKKVRKENADIGLAFDGDGDRVVAVDEKGRAVTGDQILAICAKHMKRHGKLKNNTVVSTVMSNFGLSVTLNELDIEHIIADVGDRYVLEEMIKSDAVLGGEDSGHLIFLEDHTTGDGLLAGLKLLEAMLAAGKPLSELREIMPVYPQVLLNVSVDQKPDLRKVPSIQKAIQTIEERLKGKGRVLVRYSGTQSLCRVMVEGSDPVETEDYCRQIADAVKKAIGHF